MNVTKTFVTFLMLSFTLQNLAEQKELVDDIKDLGREIRKDFPQAEAALDEAVGILLDINDFFSHPFGIHRSNSSIDYKKVEDKEIEIIVHVPEVENSDTIEAFSTQNHLEFIVPQKNRVTKVIINPNSIIKETLQQSKQTQTSNGMESFSFSSKQSEESKMLPFFLDLRERKVKYEDDKLSIKLRLASEATAAKAKPRDIPVIDK